MTEILIGRNDSTSVTLDPHYGNRHGMIAGATGTGKSVSLMVLAEGFSRLGVPCFLADAKGDLAGLSMAANAPGDKLQARLDKLKLTDWKPQANPVVFWDIYGKLGHPVRATISEMGPPLLGRVLELNDTQQGVLEVVFKLADEQGWRVNSPRDSSKRGGSIIIDAPHAGEVVRELAARDVLVDHRPGAGIRIGPHFFNTDEEIEQIIGEIRDIIETKAYEKHLAASGPKS